MFYCDRPGLYVHYLLEPGLLVCMYEEDLLMPSPELVNVTKVL